MAKKKIKGFKINLNEIALNQRKFTTSEIGRGIGIHSVDKGKGSYKRKQKHQKRLESE